MLTAQELQAKRQEHQMTQAQLAQAVGIEVSLIARYEQGELPIPAEHEEKLETAWQHATTVPKASRPHPVKPPTRKAASTRAPSVSQWLQSVAHNGPNSPERNPTHSTVAEPTTQAAPDKIVQAAAQITNDKQRRVALNNLLTAALSQIDRLFAEDKQIRTMAEAIEQLDPTYQQVVLGLVDQFAHLDPAASTKARSATDQIVHTLKDSSAYVSVLNYLEAALQLLKQAELADRSALIARLQNLSEFDQNTVQLITKRYQTSARSHAGERAPDEEGAHDKADS